MNRIVNVFMLHARGRLYWVFLPLSIVLSSFVINLIIAAILGSKTAIYTGGLSSIYIYMNVVGSLTVKETFPFALGFSVRRRDYYLGTLVMVIATCAVLAFLIWLLSLVEANLIPGWGVNLHFFHLPYITDGPLAGQFWIFFVVMVCMYFLGFMPGALFQRFSSYGLYALAAAVALPLTIVWFAATRFNWWGAIFGWFARQSAFDLASWTVLLIALCALASYAFLRKATV